MSVMWKRTDDMIPRGNWKENRYSQANWNKLFIFRIQRLNKIMKIFILIVIYNLLHWKHWFFETELFNYNWNDEIPTLFGFLNRISRASSLLCLGDLFLLVDCHESVSVCGPRFRRWFGGAQLQQDELSEVLDSVCSSALGESPAVLTLLQRQRLQQRLERPNEKRWVNDTAVTGQLQHIYQFYSRHILLNVQVRRSIPI